MELQDLFFTTVVQKTGANQNVHLYNHLAWKPTSLPTHKTPWSRNAPPRALHNQWISMISMVNWPYLMASLRKHVQKFNTNK